MMGAETIRSRLKSHDRVLYIKADWIRDPYITIGPNETREFGLAAVSGN